MKRVGAGLVFLATLAALTKSSAQNLDRIVIDAVELRGLERVSESLVRSQIEIHPGDSFDDLALLRSAAGRDIRRLYALGLFTTIRTDIETRDGQTVLIYTFQEEKIIDQIRIVGNKKLKDRQIRGVITWREGDAFVPEAYDEERNAILNLYRSKGFLNTTVDIVVEPIAPSRVRVTFIIDEGKKARISDIKIYGNEALSNRKIKRVMKTRQAFWFIGGRYDQDKFEADLTGVLNAYGDVGRLEAEIARTEFEYSDNGKHVLISIYINEGPEYHVDSLAFAGNFVYADREMLPQTKLRKGDVHNKSQVTADAEALQKLYTDSGYINAKVVPQVTLDKEAKTTTVVYQVNEDQLKYVREIRIRGNDVTKDEVVRRMILLQPGERYDQSLVQGSVRRLNASQFFEDTPRLGLEDVPGNDRYTNVLLDVTEGKTGNFNFGGAFNTDSGFGGFGELRLNNFDITNWPTFSGGGQQFSTRFFIGNKQTNLRVGFTDPEFLGYPLSVGVDAYSERFSGTGASKFTTDTTGGSLRIGKSLSQFNTLSSALTFRSTQITDLDTFVNPALRELQDPGSTLSLTLAFNRNTANDFRDPTRGGDHTFSAEVANFGLDNDFVKLGHDSTWYYGPKAWKKISFAFHTREDIGFPFGDKEFIPINERFFAGGSSTLRGYDFRAVGPKALTFRVVDGRVITDREPIGGELRILNTFEAKYIVNDLIRLYAFTDSGAVFIKPEDFEFGEFKFSVGLGLGINVPLLGPLRIDYGIPLNPDADQGHGQLHLQSAIRF